MSLQHKNLFFSVLVSAGIIVPLVQTPRVLAQDKPDLNREARFFNNYKKFGQAPTPEDQWMNAQGNSASGAYQVQKGDTLWDISDTLFADPQFWPKIWSLNTSDVLNPHEISPGVNLQFSAGSLNAPPSLGIGEAGEAAPQQPRGSAPAPEAKEEVKNEPVVSDDILERVEIPPPEKKSQKVTAVPASLPTWVNQKDKEGKDTSGVRPISRSVSGVPSILYAYISDGPTIGEGSIVQTELGGTSAAAHQYVYVKIAGAASGQKYLVLKDVGDVKDPKTQRKGILTHVQGVLQIADLVNASQSIYRALVLETVFPVEVGAALVSGDLPSYTLEEGPATDVAATIIGGAYSVVRSVYGKDQLLFLNAGSGSGLSPGQYVSVYKDQRTRHKDTLEKEQPRKIGLLKVLRVGTQFSTAVVVSGESEIRTGDLTYPSYQ